MELILNPGMERDGGIAVGDFSYPSVDGSALEASVAAFLERYPKATLQDVYKNSFQDYYGPAHIMASRDNVIGYLERELKKMKLEKAPPMKIRLHSAAAGKSSDTVGLQGGKMDPVHYYTPCGWRHNYYQVSLEMIADGLISVEDFADAFLAGGGEEPQVTEAWLEEWKLIKKAVKKVAPKMEGFKEDDARITSLIKEGKYVVHHSGSFNWAYKPHYRIMRRDIFEAVILPLIK